MTVYDYQQHLWDCINHLENWIGFGGNQQCTVEIASRELAEYEQEEEQVQLLLDLR